MSHELSSFSEYEAGKKRRYELMFAVNGGAFAIVTWAYGKSPDPELLIGELSKVEIGIGMALFNLIMGFDIYAFGMKHEFQLPGKLVISSLTWLTMAGWLLAGGIAGLLDMPRLTLLLMVAAAIAFVVHARENWILP